MSFEVRATRHQMGEEIASLIEKFQYKQILRSDSQAKQIILLGEVQEKDAIIIAEKSHFSIDEHNVNVNDLIKDVQTLNQNDIYYWARSLFNASLPSAPSGKVNLIYPATESHINKYSPQKFHYVLETPKMYEQFVEPYIRTMKGDKIKWVYNILFEGKESETFIYHDPDPVDGFVLLPDLKWDRINKESLYLCCIVKRLDISSIRDLNERHLVFLQKLNKRVKSISSSAYGLEPDELKIYVHYQPSYYHFHLHIVHINFSGLGDGMIAGKAILLDQIIENIRVRGDYYQVCRIGYKLGDRHGLWKSQGFADMHYRTLMELESLE